MNYNHLHLFGVNLLFGDLRAYQNLIEDFLHSKKVELENDFDDEELKLESKKAGNEASEYYEHLIDSYSERHHEIAKLFPHNFRASFLTQIISVIEAELKKICNHYGRNKKQNFVVDDLRGTNDLDKCKLYLKTVGNFDFNEFSKEWQFINQSKTLRNKIVHNDSKVKKTNKDLFSFIKSHDSFDFKNYLSSNGEYVEIMIIDNKFIDELLFASESFFEKIISKLEYSS